MDDKRIKLCFLDGANIITEPLIVELKKHIDVVLNPDATCDFFWNASVAKERNSHRLSKKFPNVKTINYVWDYYEWAHLNKRHNEVYDWASYAGYLQASYEVWCPSESVKKRMKEYFDIDAHVIHAAISVEDREARDDGFVLNHLREYPEVNLGITKRACEELDIPYLFTDHRLDKERWKDTVASCRFMVAEYMEASTGGLTLIEGLWNGKPALVSNSPYQGGVEYLGEWGTYFQWDDYDDFKRKLQDMWENPPVIDIPKARQFISERYGYPLMAKRIVDRMYEIQSRAT